MNITLEYRRLLISTLLFHALFSADGSEVEHHEGDSDHEPHHKHKNSHIVNTIMCLFLFSLIFGVVTLTCKLPLCLKIRIPYTMVLFFAGMILTAMLDYWGPEDESDWFFTPNHAIKEAQNMNPHIIILVILPPLIYESASGMNWHVFRKVLFHAILLAFPGMVVSLLLTGLWCQNTFGHGWPSSVSNLLGAITSATDPVAVVSALHELGAPAKLASVIDGESLLNDGSAMVFFFGFLARTTGKAYTVQQMIFLLFRLAIGGIAWGMIAYCLASIVIHFTVDNWKIEVATILTGIYGTFVIAEVLLETSGIISVVVFGTLMARRGKYCISPRVEPVLHHIVSALAFFSETAIFFLAGIVSYSALKVVDPYKDVGNLLLLYVMLHFIRGAVIFLCRLIINQFAEDAYKLTLKECLIMTWGGLRGAVGLALGMIVVEHAEMAQTGSDLDEKRANQVNFYVSGVVILTMVFNSTTCVHVYHRLGIYETNSFRQKMVTKVTADIEKEMTELIEGPEYQNDWFYRNANYKQIRSLIPDFSSVRVNSNNELENLPQFPDVHQIVIGDINTNKAVVFPMESKMPGGRSTSSIGSAEKEAERVDAGKIESTSDWEVIEKESEIAETAFAYLREYYMLEYEEKAIDDDGLSYVMEALESAVDSMHQGKPRSPTAAAALPRSHTAAAAFEYELERLNKELPYSSLQRDLKWQNHFLIGFFARYSVYHKAFAIFESLNGFVRAHESLLAQMKEDRRIANPSQVLEVPIASAKAQYAHWAAEFSDVSQIHRTIVTTRSLVCKKREILKNMQKNGLLISGDLMNMENCLNNIFARLRAIRFSFLVSNNGGRFWGTKEK